MRGIGRWAEATVRGDREVVKGGEREGLSSAGAVVRKDTCGTLDDT